ncbi:MAG: alpha/beta hydrolase, partial [Alphaproteobacteria bacterium HGW-Alphaproteobacteria-12]
MSNERGNMSIARLKGLIRERSKQADPSLVEQRKAMDANATLFPVPGGVTIAAADLGGLGAE